MKRTGIAYGFLFLNSSAIINTNTWLAAVRFFDFWCLHFSYCLQMISAPLANFCISPPVFQIPPHSKAIPSISGLMTFQLVLLDLTYSNACNISFTLQRKMTLYTSGYFKTKQLTPVHTQIEIIFLSTS